MTEDLTKRTWTKITLARCCKEISQRIDKPSESGFERFVGLEHMETGETSIRHWGSTDEVTSSMKLFKTRDVIVARRNVYLQRAARVDFDGVCSGDGIVLRANQEICLPELLPFLLNTNDFWSYVTSQADGTMSKRITVKRLMAYEFALPPLEEQRRIVEVLEAAESYQVKLDSFQGLMTTTLDSVSLNAMSSHPSAHLVNEYCDVNPESLTATQLASDEIWDYADLGSVSFPSRLSGMQPICLSKAPSRARRIATTGDILVSTVRPNLQGHALVSGQGSKIIASTGFTVLRPKKVNYKYILMGLILSSRFLQHCEGRVTGTSYPAIATKDVSNFPIPDLILLEQEGYGSIFELLLRRVTDSWTKTQTSYLEFKKSLLRELLSL